jgi:hypothetical protein
MENLIHIHDTDLSDLYKDAHGFRPRGIYKEWWTKDELEVEYSYLSKVCHENDIAEIKAEKKALITFEKLIANTIEYGAPDRETAIRWLIDGEGLEWNEYDLKYFFWIHGLSYEIQNNWTNELINLKKL